MQRGYLHVALCLVVLCLPQTTHNIAIEPLPGQKELSKLVKTGLPVEDLPSSDEFLQAGPLKKSLQDQPTFFRGAVEARPEEAFAQSQPWLRSQAPTFRDILRPRPGTFFRGAVEAPPPGHLRRRPLASALNRIAPEQSVLLESSERVPLRDAVEGRPPLSLVKSISLEEESSPLGLPSRAAVEHVLLPEYAEATPKVYAGPNAHSYDTVPLTRTANFDNFTSSLLGQDAPFHAGSDSHKFNAFVRDGSSDYKVICYYGAWATYRKSPMAFNPSDVAPNGCTHLIYSFVGLEESTLTVKSLDPDFDIVKGGYKSALGLKRVNPSLKVMIAIGGWNEGGKKYSNMASTAGSRKRFIDSVVVFMEQHGFDGFDLDWEYPGATDRDGKWADKENFALLVEEMSVVFKPRGWLLSAAVSPAIFRVNEGYDVPRVAKGLDFINVMTYDLHGAWDNYADHHAPIRRRPFDEWATQNLHADGGLSYWIKQGAPASKVIFGIPFYGRSFTLASTSNTNPRASIRGAGKVGPFTQEGGFLAYYEICEEMKNGGWTLKQDPVGSPYMYKGDQWIGYDNVEYITAKMAYIRSNGLGGAMIWAIDLDDFQGVCGPKWPLLKAINAGLERNFDAGTPVVGPTTPPVSTTRPTTTATSPTTRPTNPTTTATTRPTNPTTAATTRPTNPTTAAPPPVPISPESPDIFVCPSDGFHRDPYDCSKYYQCAFGKAYSFTCPGGLYFDPSVSVCNWPFLVSCGSRSAPATVTRNSPQYKVACYFSSWAWLRQGDGTFVPENIDPGSCTHIFYAFAGLDAKELVIRSLDRWTDIDNGFYSRTLSLRSRNPDVKIMMTLGGWADSNGDKYSRLVADASARRNFAVHAADLLLSSGFDGLHLDWQYPVCWQGDCSKGSSADRTNFAQFIQVVNEEFKKHGLVLSANVAAYQNVADQAYDAAALAENLDFISVATYDYHGGWERSTGHIAPLRSSDSLNTESSLKYWESKGIPKSKLLLGIPFYGQSYTLASPATANVKVSIGARAKGPGYPGPVTQQSGMLAYYEICSAVRNRGFVEDSTDNPFAYRGDQWVGYDNIDSVRRKAEFVKSQGYGGVSLFSIDMDDFNNVCCYEPNPLSRAVARSLGLRDDEQPLGGSCVKPAPPVTPPPLELTTGFNPGFTETKPTTLRPTTTAPWTRPTTAPPTTTAPTTPPTTQPTTTIPWATAPTTRPTTAATRPTTTTAAPTTPPVSSLPCQEGKLYPVPGDCSSYAQCVNGKLVLNRCASGLRWNAKQNYCDWPEAVPCDGTSAATTAAAWSLTTTTTPWRPAATTATAAPWRPSSTTTTTTTTKAPISDGCSLGEYTQRGPDCSTYQICVNGKLFDQKCGGGLHWNAVIKNCDWPENARCPWRSGSLSRVAADKCGDSDQFRPVVGDCSAYQICLHGAWISQYCPPGLHWNPSVNTCDWPASAACGSSVGPSTAASVYQTTKAPPITTTTTRATTTTTRTTTTARPATAAVTTKPTTGATSKPVTYPTVQSKYKVICYFTNWAWYRQDAGKYTPDDIDPDMCTHIIYGFATLDTTELIMKPYDSWADIDNRFYERVVALRQKGIKVLIALGGWNDSAGDKYSRLVNNPAARKKFVERVVQFIEKYGFDGLDLDWEYPKCWQVNCQAGPDSDKAAFSAWVQELSAAFKPRGWLLSAAVSPSKTVIDAGYDVPALSRYLDWIAVMTYDYHGNWDKKTGHVAPLYFHSEADVAYFNANYTLNYWLRLGADPSKIIMGIPLYGQSFSLADAKENGLNAKSYGPGEAGEFTRAGGFLSYYEICERVKNRGWTVVQDEEGAMGPYAYKGNQWVSYDDIPMVRRKSQLVQQMNLGGAMIWALDLDDFRNRCGCERHPLLRTINRVLRGYPVPDPNCIIRTETKPTTPTTPAVSATTTTVSSITKPAAAKESCQDNQFIRDASDCSKYYQCVFGKWLALQCPAGLVWNKDHCDWAYNTDCTSTDGLNPDSTTGTTSGASSVGPTTSAVSTTTTTTTTEVPIPPVPVDNNGYKVVCYFTNWAWYRRGAGKYTPDDIDPDMCTHVVYGFATLDYSELIMKPYDTWADIDNRFYERVVALRAKGIKVLIALGGWNDSAGDKYSRLVNNPAARRKFVERVVQFIEKYGFDGLDLDWEYPKCWQVNCKAGPDSDKPAFSAWVRELSAAFRPRGWLLSAAVSPSKTVIDAGYEVKALSDYLDWIAVMTYDYHGNWDKKTGHVAPLYLHSEAEVAFFNVNYTIHYWIEQGADPLKLVMGMPLYGQSFSLNDAGNNGLNAPASSPGQAGEFTGQGGFLAYYEICNRIKNKGWTVVQDPEGAVGPYAYSGNQWVSFDDAAMIRRKSQLVKQWGLGGAMIWALDLDDFRNTCGCEKHPLLRTINRVLRDYPRPDPDCRVSEPAYVVSVTEPSELEISVSFVSEVSTQPPSTAAPATSKPTTSLATTRPTAASVVSTTTAAPAVYPTPGAGQNQYKVICYFTNWAWYRQDAGKYTPDDIDPDMCTHIIYGFATLDTTELIMKPYDSWADIDNRFYERVVALRQKGIKVLIALGGWNDSAGDKYSRLVNNPAARKKFVERVVQFIEKYGFDGLDLDWEYPKCWQVNCQAGPDSDKAAFSAWVQELSAAFKPRGWLLSAAVSPSKTVIDAGYDVPALSRYLDWIAVMTYDYHGNWDKKTGHVAPLYFHSEADVVYFNANYTLNYWLRLGADPSKIIMGIPLYGQSFSLADAKENGLNAKSYGPGEAGEFTRAGGFLSYYEICERVKNRGWTVVQDEEEAMGPYAYKGNQWVSYDDISTVRRKSQLVQQMNLGGAMVWALDLDDFRNRCGCERHPLLRTINRVLRNYPVPDPSCSI